MTACASNPLRRISVRLTLWYSTLLMLLVAVLGGVLYLELSRALRRDLDQQLHSAAQAGMELVEWERGGLVWEGTEADRVAPDPLPAVHQQRNLVRVTDAGGRVVSSSPLLSGLPKPDLAQAARAARGALSTARLGGERVRVIAVPIRKDGRLLGVLQIVTSLAPVERTLGHVTRLFCFGGVAALAASLLIGQFLARRVLVPVAEITRAARAISATNLSERLRLPGTGDELSSLAESFDEMLDRVEAAYRRQREFASDASHELRAPLALIKGEASLSRHDGSSPASMRSALASIETEADRMTRLVEDLLLLARLDRGALLLRSDLVGLDEVAHEVGGRFSAVAAERGVELKVEAPDAVPVRGDETALRRVLMNLAQNALEHTPSGTIRIRVAADHASASMEVADTGCGIPAEHQPRLFDRFYRIESARPRGGAGLGLALCREIIGVHGGSIELESEPGRGTRVICRLPLAAHRPA